ncbi:MAG: hypothetical protein ABFE01_25435 [Phycisphaerales bacterium]
MIVYRDRREKVDGRGQIRKIAVRVRRLRKGGSVEHADAVGLLIDLGEFETAVVDAWNEELTPGGPTRALLRRASLSAGHLLCGSWQGSKEGQDLWAVRLERTIDRIAALPLPRRLSIPTSEGYAYYGLAPEAYIEAARRFHFDVGRGDLVCIGIRSIGASLSAVVAATLEEQGSRVGSWTVRCQGHPFERYLPLDDAMVEKIRTLRNRHWLIVDEGPGLSGSTLCCVADKLSELGVPDDRIVFFPGHDPDPARFVSRTARDRWPRHRKYLADFDSVWVRSGRLTRSPPEGRLTDVSAGQWRPLLFHDESIYPAVQPWHERRKYLLQPADSPPVMLKFAGFGRYGQAAHDRALLLADAGFHPPVVGLNDGFLVTHFVSGRPMRPCDIDEPFLDYVVRYLTWLRRAPTTAEPMPPEELTRMIEVNVGEGLGPRWTDKLHEARLSVPPYDRAAGVTDGRMLLHEWLRTGNGYLKTDGVDHYADHFSPSCADPAWDIAACLVEWDMSPAMQGRLVDRFIAATTDVGLLRRLRFYSVAYLAHRLGYATMAGQSLGGESPDGRRFETLACNYARLLRRSLTES